MNKKEFGALFHTSGSLVTKWEKGTVTPAPERLKMIAEKGDISIHYLLYGSDIERVKQVINNHTVAPNKEALEKTIAFFDRNPTALQHNDEEILDMYYYYQSALAGQLQEKPIDALLDMALTLVEEVTKRTEEIDNQTSVSRLQVSQNVINQLLEKLTLSIEENDDDL